MSETLCVWLKFNAVGALGIGVQLGTLTMLTNWAGMNYLPATALAVETAVIHNFVWHERWTWVERTTSIRRGRAGRLIRFHVTNGAVSLGGNVALMRLFVEYFRLSYLVAGIIAIAMCSLINFWASDRIVFNR